MPTVVSESPLGLLRHHAALAPGRSHLAWVEESQGQGAETECCTDDLTGEGAEGASPSSLCKKGGKKGRNEKGAEREMGSNKWNNKIC